MRSLFQFLLAGCVVFAATAGSQAQEDFNPKNVFTFSPIRTPKDLTKVKWDKDGKDVEAILLASPLIEVRPNTGTELYLWVLNPGTQDDDYTVELVGPDGATLGKKTQRLIEKNWNRVRLEKVAPPAPAMPPKPAPPAPPAGTQPAAPTPPPEPPPPGVELPSDKGEPSLRLRLLDKDGKELKAFTKEVTVSFLNPAQYVGLDQPTIAGKKGITTASVAVKQTRPGLSGTGTVQLLIPPQPELKGAFVREGFYRRNLTFLPKFAKDSPPKVTLTATIENAEKNVRFYVGVDGITRAFPYRLNLEGQTEARIIGNPDQVVRIYQASTPPKTATQPTTTFPVLIEADNASGAETLELKVRPAGGGDDVTDTIKVGGPRQKRTWLDSTGPADEGLLISTRSRDWIKQIDLSQLRGNVEIEAIMTTTEGFEKKSDPLRIKVDSTPPEPLEFLPLPEEVVKGQPLTVSASAYDPETNVVKATFFLFKQLDDGKIPADAIKGFGSKSLTDPKVWTAELKLPPEFRGDGMVAVVFTNEVGLSNDPAATQTVRIVEAKPALGTIVGRVEFGDRPQPGVTVLLADADRKEKRQATTDDKGMFKFEKVVPGSYALIANKKDSSTGASGLVLVQVEPDEKPVDPKKPPKITVITLSKNKL